MKQDTNTTGEVGHTPLSVADVLERAADRLEQPYAWTQGAFSRNADGSADLDEDGLAASNPVCWCAMGSIAQTVGVDPLAPWVWSSTSVQGDAYRFLSGHLGIDVADWNDAPERTQAEVVAKLREAAAIARTETHHD